MIETVAVIWTNYGPYHFARVEALAKRLPTVPIELASFQNLYGWSAQQRSHIELETLTTGAVEEKRSVILSILLWAALTKSNPSVVLVPGYSSLPALTAAVWGRLHNKHTVLLSESTSADRTRSPAKELLKRTIIRCLFDGANVGGRRNSAYLDELGLKRLPVTFGYDSVDNDFYREGAARIRETSTRDSLNLPEQYFLFVGRLAQVKNLHRLIDAFVGYRSAGGEWHLVIVGTGPLEADLKAYALRTRVSTSIHFAGFKNGAELFPYYAFARCLVLPSVSEPWGLVVNEAMASGLPILLSNRCGCADDLVAEGDNGFKFDPEAIDQITDSMTRMSSLAAEEWQRMQRASLDKIGNYSPESWAEEIVKLMELIRQ